MEKEQEKEQLCPVCGCHIGVDAYEKDNVTESRRLKRQQISLIKGIEDPELRDEVIYTLHDKLAVMGGHRKADGRAGVLGRPGAGPVGRSRAEIGQHDPQAASGGDRRWRGPPGDAGDGDGGTG